MTPIQIGLAVAGISALIAWHELGHYLFARLFGMRVVRYALGLGPKLWGFKKNDIEYQLCWLPFGGFVQIFGMSPYEEGAIDDPRAFINQPRWQRIIVYAAGPAFNYILAAALFFGFFWFFPAGTVHIDEVVPESAAAEAGLEGGDIIYGVDGKALKSERDFLSRIAAGETFTVHVKREAALSGSASEEAEEPEEGEEADASPEVEAAQEAAEQLKLEVTPKMTDQGPMLGVKYKFAHDATVRDVSFGQVAVASVVTCWRQSVATLEAFGRLFAGDDDVKLEGPLGIGKHITKAVERGARDFLWILAILSVTLGLLNLLPIPALDGIKILVLLVESVMRKNISPAFQLWMNAIGFLLLIGLMLVMTVLDAAEMMG